ncbi:MAG: ATP-binding protein [Gemmatimonadaceae bacterium]
MARNAVIGRATARLPTRGLSLGQRLPLLISALLVLVLVGSSWAGYAEVRRATHDAAVERLLRVARQLADGSQGTGAARAQLLRNVTSDDALRSALRAARAASAPITLPPPALAVLRRLASPLDSTLVLELWDAELRRHPVIGPEVSAPHAEHARSLVLGPGARDSMRTGALYAAGDSVFFWRSAPVTDASGVLGHVVSRHRIAMSARSMEQFGQFFGRELSVYVADTMGGVWSTFAGRPLPPRTRLRDTTLKLFEYERADGPADVRGTQMAARAWVRGTPSAIVLEMPRSAILERPRAFLRRVGLVGAVITLLGAAAAWVLSRRVTRPLGALTTAAEAIAAGDYGRRVEVTRGDEIGRLAGTFNAMAGRVAETSATMKDQAAQLEATAAELATANDELRVANERLAGQTAAAESAQHAAEAARAEAERASQAKSDFLAVMSHEIRTPINAMVGYTQLVEMGIAGPVTDGQRTQLERVRASGQHLLGLVNEVLDLAKVESGELSVLHERAIAADAADAALALTRPLAAAKGIAITVRCGGARHAAYLGDEQRVRQVLVNLVSNAIKFTNPGGRISIRCSTGDQPGDGAEPQELPGGGPWTSVSVEDTGIGIAPEQLAVVFEPFVQAESGLTRSRGGTGLGLAISRRLARLMGGDVTVRSRLGEGSRFTFWLPAAGMEHAGARGRASGEQRAAAASTWDEAARPEAAGAAALGQTLLDQLGEIMRAFVTRLRDEPIIPHARTLTDAQLRDHVGTFLAELAHVLIVLEVAGPEPTALLRDGGEIQRAIAERHGAQRELLGWTEANIRREFALLREVVEGALNGGAASAGRTRSGARVVLARLFEQAERVSVQGLRQATRIKSG